MGGHRGFVGLFALIIGMASAQAYAQGPLQPGDTLFAAARDDGPPIIGRVSPQGTAETIATVGGEVMAVANRNTIYTAETNATQTAFDVWKIDVVSGSTELAVTIPFSSYNWVYVNRYPTLMDLLVDSAGRIILAVNGGHDHSTTYPVYTSQNLLRFDPAVGSSPPVEELFSAPAQQLLFGRFGYSYEFDNDGTLIRGSTQDGFQRFENGSFVTIWSATPSPVPGWGDFDINRTTRELVFPTITSNLAGTPEPLWYGLVRADLSLPFSPAYVGGGWNPDYLGSNRLAVEQDGDVIWGSGGGLKIDRIDLQTGARSTIMDGGAGTQSFVMTDIDVVRAECMNGLDDDADGLVDYRADGSGDPHCANPGDNQEQYAPPVSCSTAGIEATPALWLFALLLMAARRLIVDSKAVFGKEEFPCKTFCAIRGA